MLEERNAKDSEKDLLIANLQSQLAYLKNKVFGSTSEIRHDQLDGQLNLFGTPVGDEKPAEVIEPEVISVKGYRSEEHTSELQSRFDLVCRLLLEVTHAHPDASSTTTRRSSNLKDLLIANLQSQLAYLKNKVFGSTSEIRHDQLDGQLNLFGTPVGDEKPAEVIEPEVISVKGYTKERKPKAT